MEDTPLLRIVRVRAEKDKDVLKRFGNYEKEVRAKWRAFRAREIRKAMKDEQIKVELSVFQETLKATFG